MSSVRAVTGVLVALQLLMGTRSAAADEFSELYSDIALRVFLGFRLFSDDTALGDQPAGGTTLSNSAVVGVRAQYDLFPWLAVEGEIPATVTDTEDELANLLFFDPRAHARFQVPGVAGGRVKPLATVGLSVPIVFSDNRSGFETDITGGFYGGVGVAFEPKIGALALRLDARVDILQARGDSALTSEFELLATVYRADLDRWQEAARAAREKVNDGPRPPADEDADGLPDDRDQCPHRSEDKDGFEDSDGCPDIDNDLDRVLDSVDKCPKDRETLNGFQDMDGCPDEYPPDLAALEGVVPISFASGTSTLAGNSFAVLRRAADVLRKYPSVQIEIDGHTDNQGDDNLNQQLSQARAEAVTNYLVSLGIDRARLRAVGYGPFTPIADNSTAAGRRRNRRVELHIIRPRIPDSPGDTP